MYPTVKAWLEAEHQGWLEFFHNPNPSPFWQRAKNNELNDDELQHHVETNLRHNPGGATFGWCSMMLHARQAGKLPAPTTK